MTSSDASLAAHFATRYDGPPTHCVSAPGRVNLIGEHIDYAGLSVLPIAIQRRVTLAYRHRSDTSITVTNTDPRYPDRIFTLGDSIDAYASGDWGNYLKAAAQGLIERYGPFRGIDALVVSDLPSAAGLSSSSALVVAVALALLERNSRTPAPLELAELLARAEQYVGVSGGGMDQAICLGAQAKTASRIDFNPLRLFAIPVPADWCFIVASSLVQADKSNRARTAYNQRTNDCREALATVTRALRLSDSVADYRYLLGHVSSDELAAVADRELHGVLRKRFRHVVSEAARVSRAVDAMQDRDLSSFGDLMRASHDSLRDDFDVSCPELDALVAIATSSGAVGARLTGAGFGGCIVALCRRSRSADIMRALVNEFYRGHGLGGEVEDVLFIARPSEGARVRALGC